MRRFLFDGAILSPADISRAIEDSSRDFAAGRYGLWLIRETGATELADTAVLRPLEVAVVERLGMTPSSVSAIFSW